MTPKRPKELKFIGERYPDGRPVYFLDIVPDRDLTEEETDALSQDDLKAIRDSGLYREVHAPAPKKAAARKSTKTATNAPAPEPEAGPEEPTTAAEPATD
jgi:hypothetical protein